MLPASPEPRWCRPLTMCGGRFLVDRCTGLWWVRPARSSDKARVFHWPLEFPDVMSVGGFDAVIGNPPWERIKLQEQEFFASREPEIAMAPNADARGKMIAGLKGPRDQEIVVCLMSSSTQSGLLRLHPFLLARAAVPSDRTGRYQYLCSVRRTLRALLNGRGGAGIIVPTGIATDATTAPFFAQQINDHKLAQLLSFGSRSSFFLTSIIRFDSQ